jgi:hypothetical protein
MDGRIACFLRFNGFLRKGCPYRYHQYPAHNGISNPHPEYVAHPIRRPHVQAGKLTFSSRLIGSALFETFYQ